MPLFAYILGPDAFVFKNQNTLVGPKWLIMVPMSNSALVLWLMTILLTLGSIQIQSY